jgi:UDP-glucose 4-epimerase
MITELSNHHVLVTGGAGFIGSHLVEEFLSRGAQVTIADNFSTGRPSNLRDVQNRIQMRRADITRDDLRPLFAEKNITLICHTAANANVPDSVKNPRTDFEKNAVATLNLLEAVRETAPRAKVIHTSSALVYGNVRSNAIKEEDQAVPLCPYAVSKLASEHYMTVYAQLYNLQTATLRLFPVYGPRLRKQVVYDLMCKLTENPRELQIQGDGTQERDFNHVANVVDAFMTVVEMADFRGEVYNVAAEEIVTIRQLAEMICERMGVSPRFVFSEARAGDTARLKGDIARLKSLGYRPRLGFAEGLTDTVRWFRQETCAGEIAKSPLLGSSKPLQP